MSGGAGASHPQAIGPYRIETRLGAGGMGEVYRAYDRRLDRRVALKRIRIERAQDPRVHDRFLREARAAARLNHPILVQIHDIVEAEGCLWIVMELVEGKTLAQLLQAGPLDPQRALPLALEIATGLGAAHAAGVVHRDLKPENVVVLATGHAKILDFSLAKQLWRWDKESAVTVEGQMLGTPRAMSPEQAMGREVDHRSDLFSLGSLLYEVVTGVSPFVAPNLVETMGRVCNYKQPSVTQHAPQTPPEIAELIDRLLEKKPSDRPQSADEVTAALRRIADSLHIDVSVANLGLADDLPAGSSASTHSEAHTLHHRGGSPVTAPHRSDERRQVTVMWCDLVGAAGASGSLEPEVVYEVMPEFQTLASQAIEHFEGYVGSVLGHRLLVYFGYPRAHEDDARRAVLTGLELIAQVPALEAKFPSQRRGFALKIAIHTGPAVVRSGSPQGEQLALGQTLDLASEIQKLAEANSVVVSHYTQRLIGGFFDLEPLGPVRMRGSEGLWEVHRVLAAKETYSRVEGATLLTPMVARERELELLLNRWQLAKEGTGQVVLLSGEAGIGKSRLVHTLRRGLAEESPAWFTAVGSPYACNSPLYPVIELVHRLIEIRPEDSRVEALTRLESVLAREDLPLLDFVSLLAPLLSLPLDEGRYPPLGLSPENQKEKTLEALLALLVQRAEKCPVVLVFEDLHWFDPSSLELLDLLIDQAAAVSLLVVLTFRLEFEAPWGHRTYLTQLNLNHLTNEQAERLVDGFVENREAHDRALPPEVRRQIVAQTDGVPLFVEELTKTVLESRFDWSTDGGDGTAGTASLSIPATLRESLTARLDHLGTAKQLAQLAACVGREFSQELLAAVSPLAEAELRHELERLVRAELVRRRGYGSRTRYLFKHALIQDAAYESLLDRQRRECHAQLARALVERFPDIVETQPELVAHHYTAAGEVELAVDYWRHAGERAFAHSGVVEAREHLNRGLGLLARLGESPGRDQQELGLQAALGALFITTRGYGTPEVDQAYGRALEICQCREDAPELFWVLLGVFRFHCARANLDNALELGQRLVRLAEAQEDPAMSMAAHFAVGITHFCRGTFETSHHHLVKATGFDRHDRDWHAASQTGEDMGVGSLIWDAFSLWFLGYPDRSLKRSQEAITLARGIAHPFSLTYALAFDNGVSHYRRDAPRVVEHCHMVIDRAREQGSWFGAAAKVHLEWAFHLGGHGGSEACLEAETPGGRSPSDAGAVERVRRELDAYSRAGIRLFQTMLLCILAEVAARQGHLDEARRGLDEALAAIDNTGERFCEAEVRRLRGELELAGADTEAARREAETWFQGALDLARSQGTKSLELRVARSLARLWVRRGKRRQARELLSGVYDWFTEGHDTPDLKEARALLDELQPPKSQHPPHP